MSSLITKKFFATIAHPSHFPYSYLKDSQLKAILNKPHKSITANYSSKAIESRYQDKLLQIAKEKGFDSIQELKEHLKEELEEKKKELNKIDPLKELEEYQTKMIEQNPKHFANKNRGPIDASKPQQPFKTLDSFLNVAKIKELSQQEIEYLWRARWSNKENVLSAVVPVDTYNRLIKNAKENPSFVLPLPRTLPLEDNKSENGKVDNEKKADTPFELHYVQWAFPGPNTTHCMLTSLAEYKLHKEFSRPHTTLAFHSELAQDKNIVLMNGQVEKDSNISLQDAQLLLLNIQRFYGAMGESTPISKKRVQLLRDFTKGSPDFNVELLISLSQSMEN
ncbi:related to Protein ATP11, mitochondrial [Saccharomycodes ludwigii]|uniref:Related to Protein ATP11, mitochondrial n=1 Tax=Saccharomycodes ludwigii TaxID=36035 RepID=A0A376BBX0_9ASCO|nr:hypothetical protein SCDLUD_005009 [Saccharomycodes ludwigii]KAH3898686.1 hypothetical protein SCDLUD_005009 [Saccharomycodes ludwigii]SSD62116.1 related to Protein ATP11, mitochondrial [Saccharomycodes ludwigii]